MYLNLINEKNIPIFLFTRTIKVPSKKPVELHLSFKSNLVKYTFLNGALCLLTVAINVILFRIKLKLQFNIDQYLLKSHKRA